MYKLKTYTELEIGHRLMTSYAQKCRHLHGHRYEVEVCLKATELNADGMVIDFKLLKEIVKKTLDDQWDHGFAVKEDDPMRQHLTTDAETERLHVLPENPTLEYMVKLWYGDIKEALVAAGVTNATIEYLEASETAKNTCRYSED